MIKSIKITNLLGRFDYHLEFNDNKMMIITGPNGFGKSTIIKIVNDLCNSFIDRVLDYSYESFSIECSDGNSLLITKNNDETFNVNSFSLPLLLHEWKNTPEDYRKYFSQQFIDERYVLKLPNASTLKGSLNIDDIKDPFLLFILNTKIYDSSKYQIIYDAVVGANSELIKIKKSIGKVNYIKEQRLIRIPSKHRNYPDMNNQSNENVVEKLSGNLIKTLTDYMRDHSEISNDRDSTYVARLFSDLSENKVYNLVSINEKLEDLRKKQDKLSQYGLLSKDRMKQTILPKVNNEQYNKYSVALSIYIDDANLKYSKLSGIIEKLELYEKIVNKKLSFKKMTLSISHGIEVKDDNGVKIPLDKLSSGEQEILILYYELIFKDKINLLLIDEPEISLHVAWQNDIMNDFRDIIAMKNDLQIIIATHSPQLITGNWDIQQDLWVQYNE